MGGVWLGYHRISRVGDRPDTPISEGEAAREIKRLAARIGVEVELLPVEKDETGGRVDRPVLERGVRAIESGQYGGLLVAQYDRLSRAHLADAYRIIQRVEEAGGQVLSARENFDITTPEGQMGRDVFLSMSRMQLARSKLYIRASKKSAVERGVWPFPLPPPGYTVTRRKQGGDGRLKLGQPNEVDRISRAYEAFAAGQSLSRVATQLGVGLSHARKILSNRAYLGEIRIRFRDGEEFVNPIAHEPLLDRPLFEACQRSQPRPPRKGNKPALLAGLVKCAHCGDSMTPGSSVKGGPHYKCCALPKKGRRCTSPAMISQRKLDPHVEALVLPHIESIQATARTRTEDLDELARRLAEAEAERDLYQQTVRLSAAGVDTFLAGASSRQAEVDRLATELGRVKATMPAIPDVPELGELYRSWPVETRRHLLRGALTAVVVSRGRGPCDGRVRIQTFSGVLSDNLEGEVRSLRPEHFE